MENQVILEQFEEIEQKVEKLIERCQSLEADNFQLTDKINRLEQELREKADVEKSYAEEKTFIRSKIDSLLGRLKDVTETSKKYD